MDGFSYLSYPKHGITANLKVFIQNNYRKNMATHKQRILIDQLKTYQSTRLRVDSLLGTLIALLKRVESPSALSCIYQQMAKQADPFKILKWAVLVHRAILETSISNCELMLDNLEFAIECSLICENREACQFLQERVLKRYASYLRKRAYDAENRKNNPEEFLTPIQECYMDINLLMKGLRFADSILQLSRYYSVKYGFIMDFNITIGVDVSTIYRRLKKNFNSVAISSEFYQQLVKEIEEVHEGLYMIFYNCYNYEQMKDFCPNFIDTDGCMEKSKALEKSKQRGMKNKSACPLLMAGLEKRLSHGAKINLSMNVGINANRRANSSLLTHVILDESASKSQEYFEDKSETAEHSKDDDPCDRSTHSIELEDDDMISNSDKNSEDQQFELFNQLLSFVQQCENFPLE